MSSSRGFALALAFMSSALPVRAGCTLDQAEIRTVDLADLFADMEATFVLFDSARPLVRVFNPERAATRFVPASTFKIPNALIALATGVASGPGFAIAWDPQHDPPADWWPNAWRKDQTLESALRSSAVWYFRRIARSVGPERMQQWVDRFGYGNRATSEGTFWLEGPLKISPNEQVEFLCRMNEDELGVSPKALDDLRRMILLEEHDGYQLSGKTGTAEVTSTKELGWLVGFVERHGTLEYYALNMEGERVWEDWPPQKRTILVQTILDRLEMMPRTPAQSPTPAGSASSPQPGSA